MKTEITVDAIAENNDKVIDFINGILAEAECSKKAIVQLDVAVEEIFVNIAHYAYAPGSGKARIIVEVLKDSSAVRITFIDSGKPYDPLAKQDPDITLSSEETSQAKNSHFLPIARIASTTRSLFSDCLVATTAISAPSFASR